MHEISGYGFGQFSSDWVIGTFYEKYWHVLLGPSPEKYVPFPPLFSHSSLQISALTISVAAPQSTSAI